MSIFRDFVWESDLKVDDPGVNKDYYQTVEEHGHNSSSYGRMTPEQQKVWDEFNAKRNAGFAEKRLSPEEMGKWAYQRYIKDYLRCIAAIDDNVGRLLDYLDESGQAENTIVIYCSDQGFYLGEHGWFDKRWMFEESMRMPLIMRWPGRIKPGSRYAQMVQNIDYAPTFLEICGSEAPADTHGTSFLPIIDEGKEIHDILYYHYYSHGGHGVPKHDGVRNQRYKLIHFYSVPEFNLFDLEKDPNELVSVHDDPGYAAVMEEMMSCYRRARADFAVPDQYGPEA